MGTTLAIGAGKTEHREWLPGKEVDCMKGGAEPQGCRRSGALGVQKAATAAPCAEGKWRGVPDTQRSAAPPSELRGILPEARMEGISGLRRASDFLLL